VQRHGGDERVSGIAFVAAMAALMWLVEVLDRAGARLDEHGIEPREAPDGLLGILFAPFLHGSWGHVFGALGGVLAARVLDVRRAGRALPQPA
jgi:membrane associated rhomboid family serine protease